MNYIIAIEINSSKTHVAIHIPKQLKDYLKPREKILKIVLDGISINLLTFWSPNIIIIGDAFEHGLGAFNTYGQAWQ